jgi:excisionase family DNA binding protein
MNLLRVEQVAKILDTSVARVYELIRDGLLPAVHLGRQVRVADEILEEWIAEGGRALPGGWRQHPARKVVASGESS